MQVRLYTYRLPKLSRLSIPATQSRRRRGVVNRWLKFHPPDQGLRKASTPGPSRLPLHSLPSLPAISAAPRLSPPPCSPTTFPLRNWESPIILFGMPCHFVSSGFCIPRSQVRLRSTRLRLKSIRLAMAVLRKMHYCRFFWEPKGCDRGDHCGFAHHRSEIGALRQPKASQVAFCSDFNLGLCWRGDMCTYRHDHDEWAPLRVVKAVKAVEARAAAITDAQYGLHTSREYQTNKATSESNDPARPGWHPSTVRSNADVNTSNDIIAAGGPGIQAGSDTHNWFASHTLGAHTDAETAVGEDRIEEAHGACGIWEAQNGCRYYISGGPHYFKCHRRNPTASASGGDEAFAWRCFRMEYDSRDKAVFWNESDRLQRTHYFDPSELGEMPSKLVLYPSDHSVQTWTWSRIEQRQ